MQTPAAGPLTLVGLGNPGTRYQRTRHNVGADWVRLAASDLAADMAPSKRLQGSLGEGLCGGARVVLFVPDSYVNESGGPVAKLVAKKGGKLDRLLVVHDEVDLPCGRVRLKSGGGTAGHNGLRSLAAALGGGGFLRMRIGVGHPGSRDAMIPHVLGKPSPDEGELLQLAFALGLQVLPDLAGGDWEAACRSLHSQC